MMKEIKRLTAVLAAVVMITANIASAAVYADEVLQENEDYIQETDEYIQYEITEDNSDTDNPEEQSETTEASEDIQYSDSEMLSEEMPSDEPEVQQPEPENFSGDTSENQEAMAVTNGQGEIEGLVNTKVFQVNLPVKSDLTDYVADPQRLIYRTDAAKHPDSVYADDANVFFFNGEKTFENGTKKKYYTNHSNPLVVVNKSSCPVNVVARVSAYYEQGADNPVSLSADREWEGVKKPGIWLSVINDVDGSQVVLNQNEQVITASIAGCPGAYRYVYEDNGTGESEYNYRLMTDEEIEQFRKDEANAGVDTEFKQFSLSMTGECNSEADWEQKTDYDFPSTSIIWNVGVAVSAKPFINNTEYTVAYGDAIDIPYSLGLFNSAASSIVSADFISVSGESLSVSEKSDYFSCDETMMYVTSELAQFAHNCGGGILRIGFDDPERTTVDIILDDNAPPSLDESEIMISPDDKKLTVGYDYGTGNKAADAVLAVSFGGSTLTSSEYSDNGSGKIVLNASVVRDIKAKNGGNIYLTFNDRKHTRLCVKVSVE